MTAPQTFASESELRSKLDVARPGNLPCLTLRSRLRRIAAAPLIRRFDRDVLERDGAGVLNELAGFDAAKHAVGEANVFNHRAGKARDPHHARTGFAAYVLNHHIADDGFVRPIGAGLVEKIYRQNGFGDAADLDVAHENILDHSA